MECARGYDVIEEEWLEVIQEWQEALDLLLWWRDWSDGEVQVIARGYGVIAEGEGGVMKCFEEVVQGGGLRSIGIGLGWSLCDEVKRGDER